MSAWSFRHWCAHADQLASMRARCWSDAQLHTLDQLALQLAEMYTTDAPASFDPDWFCDRAKRGHDRTHNTLLPTEGSS